MLSSLGQAMDRLEQLLGPDRANWQWGRLHHAAMDHTTAAILDDATSARFSVGPLPRGGRTDTVGNTSYQLSDLRQTGGRSNRTVLDVVAWDNSIALNAPGESRNPKSPDYKILFSRWTNDEAFQLYYIQPHEGGVRGGAAHRAQLSPGHDRRSARASHFAEGAFSIVRALSLINRGLLDGQRGGGAFVQTSVMLQATRTA